jgi:parallel beta-helix repeat protein
MRLYVGSSVGIINNRIERTTNSDGITIASGADVAGCVGCVVSGNTIRGAHLSGIWLGSFSTGKIHNNAVTASGNEGIYLNAASVDNLILDNVSGQNGENGMLIDGQRNHVERNVLNMNLAWGLRMDGTLNTYRGNTAHGNTGGSCPGTPATTDLCDATSGGNNSMGDNFMPGIQ